MKKILLMLLPFLLQVENANGGLFGSSNPTVDELKKFSSKYDAVASPLAKVSTACDAFSQKNCSGEHDVAMIIALRILTKNTHEFFTWLKVCSDQLKTFITKKTSAQEALDKAKSDKQTTKAQSELDQATETGNRIFRSLLGNGMRVLVANVKAAATIYLQLIKATEFSQADIAALKKNFSPIKTKADDLLTSMRSFKSLSDKLKEAAGDDVEIAPEQLSLLEDDINAVLDLLIIINDYLTSENVPGNVDDTLTRLSLAASNRGSRDSSSRRSSADDNSSTGRGSSRSAQRKSNADDDAAEDDDDARTSQKRGSSASLSRGSSASTSRRDSSARGSGGGKK
ncbi:MAG: hypothetical protein LBC04_02780 [Holosporaceae bacterium]|nr:hypothetical protein [Holosporaceae bacterium]